jgi:predicted  nucleic acid-binding Zn-ribbon protein
LSREKLKALEELQRIDLQIRDLSAQAENHPARLKQIEADRTAARQALDSLRGKLADNERARRQNEQLLSMEKEKVKKWESRLNELKTPREYAALARELDIAKKTNITAEEDVKRLAGEYDELRKQVAEAEQGLGSKEAVVSKESEEIQKVLAGIGRKVAVLEKEREAAVTGCDRALLSRYERLRKQRGGVAVVGVVNGTCKGCNMNIPPQMANQLRTGAEVQTCPSCNRFIYAVESDPQPGANA